ncbi:endonuclease/exonuclease/phosphatase family protein [Pseudomonas wadenswilerensis]|uniref:endonuclease/exonuclease/phosphatase family protein n=1 Tax=Pseudomonas wadenswilerensis TaxID=1785161 RepID=UPI00320B00B2
MYPAWKLVVFSAMLFGSSVAQGDSFRIATWNLGWHIAEQELPTWISQCSKTYAKDAQGDWKLVPVGTPQAKRGWDISESRASLEGVDLARMPPCAVYMTATHQVVEVTPEAYAKRLAQIARLMSAEIKPDVIAFQEVSGAQSVREALGDAAADYNVCSFEGAYKIQRLAFAWKRSLGEAVEACTDLVELSLPDRPATKQVRPGYTVTLNLGGKRVRFLTVHLKSGCVTPLEGDRLDGDKGADDPCPVLQQQVGPLEVAFETLPLNVDGFVVLGDFNRNLWHEANKLAGAEPLRSDGETDLTKSRAATVSTRNLFLEINDGAPAGSKARLLSAVCPGAPLVKAACESAKTSKLSQAQRKALTAADGLGCRNPVGLDHILVSETLANSVQSTYKVPIGNMGGSLPAKPPQYPVAALAISDHCPVVIDIQL